MKKMMTLAGAVLATSLLAACGGGEEPPAPVCVSDFVGPLQPGQVPPGCESPTSEVS
jgi:hypothetical protein